VGEPPHRACAVVGQSPTEPSAFDSSQLTPSQLHQIAQHMAAMSIGNDKKTLTATQRWKALQAARTASETETDAAPESSAYEEENGSSASDDEPAPAIPIRVARRQPTAVRRRR
jgi:hypothetical protein